MDVPKVTKKLDDGESGKASYRVFEDLPTLLTVHNGEPPRPETGPGMDPVLHTCLGSGVFFRWGWAVGPTQTDGLWFPVSH